MSSVVFKTGVVRPMSLQRSLMRRIATFVVCLVLVSVSVLAQAPVAPTALPGFPVMPVAPAPPAAMPAPGVLPDQIPASTPPVMPPGQGRSQTPPPAKPSAAAPAATPPSPGQTRPATEGSGQNVRLEITILDTFGATPSKKTVSMLLADGKQGRIRSSMSVPVSIGASASYQMASIGISVDAIPGVRADGRILLNLTIQYTPDSSVQQGNTPKPADINESLSVILADGRATMVSQSADPQGDRRVTIDVAATIIK